MNMVRHTTDSNGNTSCFANNPTHVLKHTWQIFCFDPDSVVFNMKHNVNIDFY